VLVEHDEDARVTVCGMLERSGHRVPDVEKLPSPRPEPKRDCLQRDPIHPPVSG